MTTRSDYFDVLLEALKETEQSGALNILTCSANNVKVNKACCRLSSKSPKYITDYLNEEDKCYLIVCTHDCKLSCDWILETTPNCQLLDETEILDAVSESNNESLEKRTVFLANLENDLGLLGVIEHNTKQKVVVVTQLRDDEVKSRLPQPTSAWKLDQDNIGWRDLSSNRKFRILLGLKKNLGLEGQELISALSSIETKILVHLLNDKFPMPENLFCDTIPLPLNYYVSRTLETRFVISKKIFEANFCHEFFLFSGIERFALSNMCKQKAIELSSNLVRNKKAISPFVYLDSEMDFESIVQTFPTNAIHLLEYESDEFIWKKSHGNISSIQNFVATEQRILDESDFICKVLAETSLSPICISDTPGKGKSILLANLAIAMKKHHKHEIVAYISMEELIQHLRGTPSLSDKSIISSMSYFLKASALGNLYLEANKHQLRELMLDGFDEIAAIDSDFALNVLTEIRKVFTETRIWITTRPHMLHVLENCLETLGYNISPFSRTDQTTFLTSFWSGRIQDYDTEVLFDFADKCLKTLEKSLGNKNDEIAGIPLQCLLIGEVYEHDAKRFLKRTTSTEKLLSQEVTTIAVLYQKLVKKKWKIFNSRYNTNNLSESEIFTAHMHLALKNLFPGHCNEFSDKLVHNMSTQEIIGFGLIEAKSILTTCEFLHRTFAEYFVALFVSELLIKSRSDKSFSFLFGNIMMTRKKLVKFPDDFYRCLGEARELTENVICYFLNTFLEGIDVNVTAHVSCFSLEIILSAAEACLYHNLENLFFKIVLKSKFKNDVMNEDLLVKAVYWVDVHFMKIMIEEYLSLCGNTPIQEINCRKIDSKGHYKNCISVSDGDSDCQCSCCRVNYLPRITLLHIAMIKAELESVEFLIKNHFWALVETNHGNIFDDLIYTLLRETSENNELIVARRRQIIHCVANLNKKLLVTENSFGWYPLEAEFPHIDLVLEIWKLTKIFYTKTNTFMVILDTLSSNLKRDHTYVFLKTVFSDLGTTTIVKLNGDTDLLENLIFTQRSTDVLNFFKDKISGFCDVNSNIRISCFEEANSFHEECILEWLLNNLPYTSEDIKVLLKFVLRRANPIGLNVLLAHIKNLQNLENLPNFFEMFKFLFSNINLLSVSNSLVIVQLASYFLWKADFNYFVDMDFENTLTYLIEHGFSFCDELVTEYFVSKSEECILKLVWLVLVCSKFPKEIFVKWVRFYLKDLDVKVIDVSGNNLLHHFASSFGDADADYENNFMFLDNFKFSSAFTELYSNDHRMINQWVWGLLVEKELNILQPNIDHQTPICLLANSIHYEKFVECFGDLILVAANQMKGRCNDNIAGIHQIFFLVLKSHDIKVVEKVYKWFIEISKSQNVVIAHVTVSFNDKEGNFLDAAIQSGNGDVIEFVRNTLQILTPLLPPPPLCIHHSINPDPYRNNKPAKYIKYLGEIFPSEINQLVNVPNDKHSVPLTLIDALNPSIVKVLLDFGANVSATDDKGNTPLYFLIKFSLHRYFLNTFDQFINYGFHINAQNLKLETPLSVFVKYAKIKKHSKYDFQFALQCLEVLLQNQADPSVPDDNGNNSLHHFVQRIDSGQFFHRVVEILISYKFVRVLETRNLKGQTPLQLADEFFNINEETKQLLRKHSILYFKV